MTGINIETNPEDDHYYDVKFKLVSFSLPETEEKSESKDSKKPKKKGKRGRKSRKRGN